MRATYSQSTTPKPNVKDSRVLTYLNIENQGPAYENTVEEHDLVNLWKTKFLIAEQEYQNSSANSRKIATWRKAYRGEFNELDEFGEETDIKMKAIHKVVYELVEGKVNPRIPAPKMSPRYYSDIVPVAATEALIKHEMDHMLSEEVHDESERATLIDSTSWFKVSWDPFNNTHERSGMPIVECCTVDSVFPQPGIYDYKKLEYIFERKKLTLATVKELYDRVVYSVNGDDLVDVIECYYLNEDRHVGKFVWVESTLQVLCNDLEWGMRRRRECSVCHNIIPVAAECDVCGSTKMKYVGVKEHVITEPLSFVANPYRSGDSPDEEDDETDTVDDKTIPAGTKIPFYLIRQLPYVPKRCVKLPKDMYGLSEVELHLESQDLVNKFLNKAERKSAMSKTYLTKLKDTRIDDEDREVAYVEVESHQEANSIQVKQIVSDIQAEMAMVQVLYEGAKSTSGITDTDQGKYDPSARSGKAKQLQIAASQSRQAAPQLQRNVAYAGVYELIFKYLLAYCDEERSFVNLLPDGTTKEEVWSKYMFLDVDKYGQYYYRDDFAWSVDGATEITQDRASMWQLIDNDYLNGVMGQELDPMRALEMYWNMKEQAGYPTAKFALAFLKESVNHLPTQIEQALINNPDAIELALSYIQDKIGGGGQGGARDNAGRKSEGATTSARQDKANNTVRANEGQTQSTSTLSTGGMEGGAAI